jgi:hypothetical protein
MHVPSDGSALAGTWIRTAQASRTVLGGYFNPFSEHGLPSFSAFTPWLNDSGRTSFLLKLKVREPSATLQRRSPPADCRASAAEVLPFGLHVAPL